MTQAEIAGTKIILNYNGVYPSKIEGIECFNYHKSIDAIKNIVDKVRLDLFMNYCEYDAYKNIVYNIDQSCFKLDATKLFTAVVAAINFINDKKKEE